MLRSSPNHRTQLRPNDDDGDDIAVWAGLSLCSLMMLPAILLLLVVRILYLHKIAYHLLKLTN